MSILKGVFTVLATPFLPDGSIDFDGMAENIEFQVASGIHGVLVAGATGEYAVMDLIERKKLVEFVTSKVNGRVPVLVGAITSRADTTIDLSNHASECGAAGVMILPPPGSGICMNEVYEFYKEVCENISIPVMLYNNPYSSGIDIDVDTIIRLADLPNVDCVKESSGDIKRISKIRRLLGDEKLGVFCGWEDMAYESMLAGATGWICMSSNFGPKAAAHLYELAVEKKDFDAAWTHYQKMLPVLSFLEEVGKPAQICKYVLDKKGLNGKSCRSPRKPLAENETQELDNILEMAMELYS